MTPTFLCANIIVFVQPIPSVGLSLVWNHFDNYGEYYMYTVYVVRCLK